MSTNDEPRIYEYPTDFSTNTVITPRVEIPLTPEAKADMIQSAQERFEYLSNQHIRILPEAPKPPDVK